MYLFLTVSTKHDEPNKTGVMSGQLDCVAFSCTVEAVKCSVIHFKYLLIYVSQTVAKSVFANPGLIRFHRYSTIVLKLAAPSQYYCVVLVVGRDKNFWSLC